MGFERSGVGGQILGFSIDSRRRPYNTLALPCECVIYKWYNIIQCGTRKAAKRDLSNTYKLCALMHQIHTGRAPQ